MHYNDVVYYIVRVADGIVGMLLTLQCDCVDNVGVVGVVVCCWC